MFGVVADKIFCKKIVFLMIICFLTIFSNYRGTKCRNNESKFDVQIGRSPCVITTKTIKCSINFVLLKVILKNALSFDIKNFMGYQYQLQSTSLIFTKFLAKSNFRKCAQNEKFCMFDKFNSYHAIKSL
jgi:hypothetical protein